MRSLKACMFDFALFAKWPRGLFLSKKLAEKGFKVAYVELSPGLKNPFGLWISEEEEEEKSFFASLGFLNRLDGGFCLLSSEGVWSFQEMRESLKSYSKKPFIDAAPYQASSFQKNWLSFLSLNLAGVIFKYNNSEFISSELAPRALNFFSDYFLFEPLLAKTKNFQEAHPSISFHKAKVEELTFDKKSSCFFVKNRRIKSQKSLWLERASWPFFPPKKKPLPHWHWLAFCFKTEFTGYENIIPPHFVSIKNIFLPWTHENLLSVFHKKNILEVWLKTPFHQTNHLALSEAAKKHLRSIFKGLDFTLLEKTGTKNLVIAHGPCIFGPQALKGKPPSLKKGKGVYLEDLRLFSQVDLASWIRSEKLLLEELLESSD